MLGNKLYSNKLSYLSLSIAERGIKQINKLLSQEQEWRTKERLKLGPNRSRGEDVCNFCQLHLTGPDGSTLNFKARRCILVETARENNLLTVSVTDRREGKL